MQKEVKDLSSDIDLSNRKHLGRKTNIRLERFVFTNPTGPQIKLREKITFKLTINADAIVEDMRLRGMMYFADGTPIGMATTKAGALKIVPGQQTVCGEINTEHLAPGAYSVRLALYCTNEYGGEQQYDVVDHAAHFVIEDVCVRVLTQLNPIIRVFIIFRKKLTGHWMMSTTRKSCGIIHGCTKILGKGSIAPCCQMEQKHSMGDGNAILGRQFRMVKRYEKSKHHRSSVQCGKIFEPILGFGGIADIRKLGDYSGG